MKKIQFGCGENFIDGWENYDMEIDITKSLPFNDNQIDAILAEHVVEHINIQDAWSFLEECHRILKKNGVLRIAVPCVSKIFQTADEDYFQFIKNHGWGDATRKDAVRSIIFNHGHRTIWEKNSLDAIIQSIGFSLLTTEPEELKGTLHHHKIIGEKFNNMETIFVDCIKL